jgi:D-3-phosphoglycerate dehydrogenase / 2-oxoglutarate reductase
MPKIIIAADLTEEAIQKVSRLGELFFVEEGGSVVIEKNVIMEQLKTYNPEILIVDATPVDKEVIDCAVNLKGIHCTRGNPVNIDTEYCREKGILVGNSPARNANAVAEFTFGLILDLMRKISFANRRLINGEFLISGHWKEERERPVEDVIWNSSELSQIPYKEFQSFELTGKTLGLVGFGAIGELIAELAKAFHMQVLVYDPYIRKEVPEYIEVVTLEQLAVKADIVSLHAKETKETIGMINTWFFQKMKKDSFLVNTSRGKLVEREALIKALENKTLAGAALDVYDYEPLCKDDPLLKLDNLLLTPHIGGASKDVIWHHSNSTVENLVSYFSQGKFENTFCK